MRYRRAALRLAQSFTWNLFLDSLIFRHRRMRSPHGGGGRGIHARRRAHARSRTGASGARAWPPAALLALAAGHRATYAWHAGRRRVIPGPEPTVAAADRRPLQSKS